MVVGILVGDGKKSVSNPRKELIPREPGTAKPLALAYFLNSIK
jgi:hypothetical protein